MNCNNVRENLIELLAEGPADAAITAHVKECSACSQELDGLRKTMALLDEWEVPEASPYFLTRLQAHVKEERTKAPQGWFDWLNHLSSPQRRRVLRWVIWKPWKRTMICM